MGRTRKHDRHLPRRVYLRRGKHYYVDHTGRWIPLGEDYSEALQELSRLLRGSTVRDMTDLLDRYEREVVPHKAARTQKDNKVQLGLLRRVFGRMRPADLRPVDVYAYRDRRGQRSRTAANRELELLSHVCTKAMEWGVMDHHPCRGVKKFSLAKRDRYVTDEEFDLVRKHALPQVQVAMDLALQTGLRRGDVLALTRENLTDDGLLVQTRKTGKPMLIEWSDELRAVVARAKAMRPQVRQPLVATRQGKAYTGHGFSALWSRAMRAALADGLPSRFTFHDIRAKSASDDLLEVATVRLGHADARITERVYRRKPTRVKPLTRAR